MRIRIAACILALVASTPLYAQQTLQELLDHAAADIAAAQALAVPPAPPGPPTLLVAPATAQAQVDAAAPGSILEFDATLVYPGLVIRTDGLTLRTQGYVPAESPVVGSMALLNGSTVVEADNLIFQGLAFGSRDVNDVIWCAESADAILFDNIHVYGHPVDGAKNGITLNCTNATVRRSLIDDIFRYGQESHGIIGTQGAGPYTIEHNVIRAASIGVMFGGDDPTTLNLVPSNISITNNVITKKLAWRSLRRTVTRPDGSTYQASLVVKNSLELKNARVVLIADNLLEYSWVDGQTAFGLVLSIRNQSGGCPWCIVEQVVVSGNTIRNVGTAVAILGRDYTNPSGRMNRVTFRNNTFDNINASVYGGRGATFEIAGGPDTLTIEGTNVVNTTWVNSAFIFLQSHLTTGLVVRNNPRLLEGEYGIIGDGSLTIPSLGEGALNVYAPGTVWEGNGVVDYPARVIRWPAGTTFVQ